MRSRGWGPHERDERPWKRGPDGVASFSTTCGTQCEDGGLAARGGSRRRHTGQHPDLGLPAFGPEQQIPAGSAAPTPAFCRAAELRLTSDSIRRSRGTRASPSHGPWTRSGSASPGGGLGLLCTDPPGLPGPSPILLILPPLPDGLPEPALYSPRHRPGHSRRKHFWKSPVHPT